MSRSTASPQSIPAANRAEFAKWLKTKLEDTKQTTKDLAAQTSIAETTLQAYVFHPLSSNMENISLWVLVAIADAFGVRADEVVEAIHPGHALHVRQDHVEKARQTVQERLARQRRSRAAVIEQARTDGTVVAEGERLMATTEVFVPPPVPIAVPSALDLMLSIKRLSEEDRLLVAEFIKDVTA